MTGRSVYPFLCLLILLAALPAQALAGRFEARYDQSHWQVTPSRARCEARQEIPQFGRAIFTQSSGSGLLLRLELSQAFTGGGSALISSQEPPWKGGALVNDLGGAVLSSGATSLQLQAPQAQQVMDELSAGRMPVFVLRLQSAGEVEQRVVLSPIRFLAAAEAFEACVARLAPVPALVLTPPPSPRVGASAQAGPDKSTSSATNIGHTYRVLSGRGNEVITIHVPEKDKK